MKNKVISAVLCIVLCIVLAACNTATTPTPAATATPEVTESPAQTTENAQTETPGLTQTPTEGITATPLPGSTTLKPATATPNPATPTKKPTSTIKPTASGKPTPRPTPVMQIPFDKVMNYIWKGGTGTEVFQEHVMFIDHNDGKGPRAKLLFKTTLANIVDVRNVYKNTSYSTGFTYDAASGEIRLTKGSPIQYVTESYLYPASSDFHRIGGGGLLYNEWIYTNNIAVTYKRTSTWDGPEPSYVPSQLPKTLAKLKNNKQLHITWYGDSISTGCNATGVQGHFKPPFQPSFFALVSEKWADLYDANVTYKNVSTGGWTSNEAVANMNKRLADSTDLLVIAFGINDSNWGLPGSTYKSNYKALINKARTVNPNCEIILVSSMLSNPEWARSSTDSSWVGSKIETEYRTALNELADEYSGVAVADVTAMHRYLLDEGKSYQDMTGNHMNHPDDYLIRIYAQTIAAMLDESLAKK